MFPAGAENTLCHPAFAHACMRLCLGYKTTRLIPQPDNGGSRSSLLGTRNCALSVDSRGTIHLMLLASLRTSGRPATGSLCSSVSCYSFPFVDLHFTLDGSYHTTKM